MNAVTLLIIVAVVGCGLIAVLVNGNILSRPRHHTGEDLINNPLVFHTATDLDVVASKIIAEIAPCRREGSSAELYLATAEPTGDGSSFVLLYCAGGGRDKVMETAVLLKSSGVGTSGSVGIETWQTVNGVIDAAAVHTARSVRDGVRRVVARLDSAAEFNERI